MHSATSWSSSRLCRSQLTPRARVPSCACKEERHAGGGCEGCRERGKQVCGRLAHKLAATFSLCSVPQRTSHDARSRRGASPAATCARHASTAPCGGNKGGRDAGEQPASCTGQSYIHIHAYIHTHTYIYTCVCVCMRLAHWFLQVSFPCSSRHAKCSTAQGRMDAHLASLVEARSVQVQWRRLHTWRCAGKLVGRALGVARAAGRRLGQQPHWPDLFECARPPPRYACAGTTRPRRVATVLHASPLHALPLFNSGSPPPPPPPLLSRSQPCRALCFFSKYKQV